MAWKGRWVVAEEAGEAGMSRLKWVIIASSRKVEGAMVFLEGRSS